ncbi:MAG: HD domain-containing protein [Gammaproteobacteria bacterium]|nr:HD domain-containing protein [Gammaproteobacteria bacterium]
MAIQIDLNQAIYALSDALDLVGIDEVAHGKRVGYMAFKCAETIGLEKQQRERLFYLGLLHDCGVSSTRLHQRLISELRWENDSDHAINGARLLSQSEHLNQYAPVVHFHHTPWKQLKELEHIPDSIKFDANLIYLVDRVDTLAVAHYNRDLQEQIDPIRQQIQSYRNNLFNPQVVDYFLDASASDSFWLMMEHPHLARFMVDIRAQCEVETIENDDVKDIARIFAQIVDAKSKFTYEHSVGVASLARHIASQLGYDEDTLDKIEIAGLLHDLGKLRVPDEILDKPAKLDTRDMHVMHRHSFETYQVLREIPGFDDIALWASYHHEKADGSGYPFKRAGEELSNQARIIAVADVFQALAQDRPYRAAMPVEQICSILQEMADDNLLDGRIVDYVIQHATVCHQHAVDLSMAQTELAVAQA